MFGEGSLAESALAEGVSGAEPIIPEVGVETRQLVFVIEMNLIAVATE
jgi:hypothetical protein